MAVFATAAPETPELTCQLPAENGSHLCSDGVVELKWSETGSASHQLEQRTGEGDYILRYSGPDHASVRTGLAEGDHSFRVRAVDSEGNPGQWSEIEVRVEYMDAGRVRILLITGGIVVLSTISAIVFGHLNHRKGDPA